MRWGVDPTNSWENLRSAKPVRCDEPALFVLGLTLANWNGMISLALAGVAGFGARRAA